MKERYASMTWSVAIALICTGLTVQAQEEKEEGLTEVTASDCLTVRRGTDEAVKEKGIHAKNLSKKTKHKLDRFGMIRFDSEDFGKPLQVAGLQLRPFKYDHEEFEPMRFRVYGVKDGDEQDETFDFETYDPLAEDTILDRRIDTMLDRRQVVLLGTFRTVEDELVLFRSRGLLTFLRQDTNGTVTLVVTRETEGPLNSRFSASKGKNPPTLLLRLADEAASADEQADPASEQNVQDDPPVAAE